MGSASRLPMSCRWPATQSTFGRCWLHSSACSRRSSREAYTITRIHYYTKRLSALRVDFAKLRGTLSGRLKGGSPCLRKAGLIRRPAFVCPRTTSDVWSDSGGHERLTTVICRASSMRPARAMGGVFVSYVLPACSSSPDRGFRRFARSEEHTSELQSLRHLVCR